MNFGKILALVAGLMIPVAMLGLGHSAYAADSDMTAASSAKTPTKISTSRKGEKSVAHNGSAKVHSKANGKATGLGGKSKAASHTTAAQPSSGPSKKSELGTDFDFQGLAVGGKYNSADGILTTVEGDKSLDNLLTPRPNFKDRLAVAAESQ